MKIKRNGKWEYVPDILFEDGTYKDVQDYIDTENRMEKEIKEALKRSKKGENIFK